MIIECGHDAGFFSCSIAMLDQINRHLKDIVDENNKLIDDVELISTNQYKFYKPDNLVGSDIRKYFFQTNKDVVRIPGNSRKLRRLGCLIVSAGKCYRNVKNFDVAHYLTSKYFSLSDELFEMKKSMIEEYDIDVKNVCGIYYRSTDKYIECIIPKADDIISKAKDVLKVNPEIKFLVQSDSASFLKKISLEFPDDKVIIINENVKKGEFCLHRTKKISQETKFENIKQFLVIVNILADCKFLIHGTGNVNFFILLIRGNFDNCYQAFIKSKKERELLWI